MEDTWLSPGDISQDLIKAWFSGKEAVMPAPCDLSKADQVYNDDMVSAKKSKSDANDVFVSALKKTVGLRAGGRIVYLDAKTLHTTRRLLSGGFSGPLVPVNFDHDVFLQMCRAELSMVAPFYGSLHQYLKKYDYPMKGLWADYCSTLDGNDRCLPRDDIRYLFSQKLLAASAVAAFTFCLRDRRCTNMSHGTHRTRIKQFIRRSAEGHYDLRILHQTTYAPNMFFIVYSCTAII